jgi:hypothetical protein
VELYSKCQFSLPLYLKENAILDDPIVEVNYCRLGTKSLNLADLNGSINSNADLEPKGLELESRIRQSFSVIVLEFF